MSDETNWHAPGASAPSAAPSAPPAPTSLPAYGPPPAGAPGQMPPPVFVDPNANRAPAPGVNPAMNTGWAPPPKPGLIPLRPLSFGTILGAPYQALRRNPRPTFGVSLLIQGVTIFITIVVVGLATFAGLSRLDTAAASDQDAIIAGTLASAFAAALIPLAFSLVASGIMQGIVVLEVARQTLGEKLKFARLWSMAKGRLWAVAGYTVLLTVALMVAIAIIIGIVVVISLLGDGAVVVAVILGLLLALATVAVVAWIGTKIAFVPSIMVLERTRMAPAIARSWALTNGRFWYTFGALILVAVIINFAASVVTTPLQLIPVFGTTLFSPTGDPMVGIVILGVGYLLTLIASVVVAAVTIVVQSATTVLLYIDARMRKEGLDLDLVRFVEARQTGDTSVADPFLHA